MNKNILLAQDIDNNKKTIMTQIETNIIAFNKIRLKKKIKEAKTILKNKFSDDLSKQELSKEEIEKITNELIHDEEANNFRLQQKELFSLEKENYYIIRKTINGLNDLNEFSSEIEKNKIGRAHV